MRWRESLEPVRMVRIAVAAPVRRLRDVLVRVADAGVVEFDGEEEAPEPGAALSPAPPGPAARRDVLMGERRLTRRMATAVTHGEVSALPGWAPASAVPALSERLGEVGGAVVELPRPRGVDAPSLLRAKGLRGSMTPLVETYGTVPYEDIDPTPLAVGAYLLMFGMMFGDVGDGALLLLLAGVLARWPRVARMRRAWPMLAGAGLAGIAFGLLYGEAFGPTGLPTLWLEPLDHPVPLMVAGIGVGAVLIAGAFLLGTLNRFREGGWPAALYAATGIAGSALFVGLGLLAAGLTWGQRWLTVAGAVLAGVGMALTFLGFLAEGGVFQAVMEVFDTVLGLGSNLASFARLAAFGLTHAALSAIVWDGTRALWSHGPAGGTAAVVLFTIGNLAAFVLEALVVAIQALRLEYYELFSRVFRESGRPFRPWHIPIVEEGVPTCPPGSLASH